MTASMLGARPASLRLSLRRCIVGSAKKQGPSLKARLYFHPGNQLRVVKGAIETRSGASPTVYVVSYDASSGRCKVLIVGSEEERWEENWDLSEPHGPERATFMRGPEGEFSLIEVHLKSS